MSKGSSSVPSQPDPMALAASQAQSNIQTAQATAALNNINTTSLYGTTAYTPYTDPATGLTRYNLTQQLSPEMQQLFETQRGGTLSLADIGQRLTGYSGTLMGPGAQLWGQVPGAVGAIPTTLDMRANYTAPTLVPGSFRTDVTTGAGGQTLPQVQTAVPGAAAGIQTTLPGAGVGIQPTVSGAGTGITSQGGTVGPIQTTLSPDDFGAQIKKAQDAAYNSQTQYLDPQFKQQEETLRQRLADQGIQEGSDAHSRAIGDFNRQKDFAYQSAQNAATTAGNQLQQQLFTQRLQSGQFANAAEAQKYVQDLENSGFINSAQAQTFGQQLQAATYGLGAQAQGFQQGREAGQFANAAQAQGFGQQVAAGQFGNAAQAQMLGQGVSLANLFNQAVLGATGQGNTQAQLGLTQAEAAQRAPIDALSALLSGAGGVFGAGTGAAGAAAPFFNMAPTWPLSIPQLGGTPSNVQPTNIAALTNAATSADLAANQISRNNLSSGLGLANLGSQALFGQNLLGGGGLFGSSGLLGGAFGGGGAASAAYPFVDVGGAGAGYTTTIADAGAGGGGGLLTALGLK